MNKKAQTLVAKMPASKKKKIKAIAAKIANDYGAALRKLAKT